METPPVSFSVVIPSRNRPDLLREAVTSVLEQTLPPAEIIIVDDASSIPVNLQALSAQTNLPIRVIRHTSARGGAAAKNTGVRAARGDILAFLDDDDMYAPHYLQRAASILATHPETDVVFMAVEWFGVYSELGAQNYQRAMSRLLAHAEGNWLAPDLLGFDPALVHALLLTVPMAFQRPVVRAAAFKRIGDYTEHCILWDCDWALRAALDGSTILCQEPLYRQRAEGQGYFSQAECALKHLHSNIEIRERLSNNMVDALAQQSDLRAAFRRSCAQSYFNLAYYLNAHGQHRAALHAWLDSQRRYPSLHRTKFLLRLLTGALNRTQSSG